MTDSIVDFLNTRLDEDERMARAACARQPSIPRGTPRGTWTFDDGEESARREGEHRYGPNSQLKVGAQPRVEGISSGCVYNSEAEMIHIARHNPARVLREVEAKRRIVATIVEFVAADWGLEDLHENNVLIYGLKPLASPYTDHPDFRQEWA